MMGTIFFFFWEESYSVPHRDNTVIKIGKLQIDTANDTNCTKDGCLVELVKILFSSPQKPKKIQDFPSHPILRYMH